MNVKKSVVLEIAQHSFNSTTKYRIIINKLAGISYKFDLFVCFL